MKRVITILAWALLVSMLVFSVPVLAKDFKLSDIQSTSVEYSAVQAVLTQGWMGASNGRFLPTKTVTRAEFAVILTKYLNQTQLLSKQTKLSFVDVTKNEPNRRYIELQKAVIPSYKVAGKLYFKPNNFITREDALVAIVKAKGLDDSAAADYGITGQEFSLDELIDDAAKVSPQYKDVVTIGVSYGVIDLVTSEAVSLLNPKANITRADLAKLLVAANDTSYFDSEAVAEPDDPPEEVVAKTIAAPTVIEKGTIILLDNGQIWECTQDILTFSSQAGADVSIFTHKGISTMIVSNATKKFTVERIK